ncbi:hypothetical protein EVG20_g1338 [Dentipellis fragilis]|uniref:Pyridoxamine 5'-phosphate oxidase N-terminal domain-containing protein n=1 Tax=Dentipellis fragilis TaxID=205917 RepID=A0A4Y9ZB21_9AGAM|nr:hypothetical protein EVG20_g1338 [Dentipellis fragilis]
MGKFFDHIPANILEWLPKQHMFWVATAPLAADGHVNVSPKGLEGTFHIIDQNTVWYEDLTGSGVETISHLRENGRITVLFNAFDGPPRICRIFGKGTVREFGTPEYEKLLPPSKRSIGSRSAIVVDVHKVGTSCGYSVPYYEFVGNRDRLMNWNASLEKRDNQLAASCWMGAEAGSAPAKGDEPVDITTTEQYKKAAAADAYPAKAELANSPSHAEKGLVAYWIQENLKSIDGLTGMTSARRAALCRFRRLRSTWWAIRGGRRMQMRR